MKNKIKICAIGIFISLLFGCSSEPKHLKTEEQVKPTDTPIINDTVISAPAMPLNAEEESERIVQGIEFGYCNEEGKEVLLLGDTLSEAEKLVKVISDSGKTANIVFINKRKPTKEDNNRKTYFNFKNAGGYLYEVKNATVSKEWSLVLVSDDFLSNRKSLSFNGSEKIGLALGVKERIEKDKGRKIKKIKRLKQIDLNKSIYLFEFVIKKDSALVTLAYIDKDRVVYHDYPALYNDISTWRVDDGGEFGLDYLNVLAVFENAGKTEIVVDWAGAEGYSITYFIEENGKFTTVKSGYRYAAPE